MHERDCGPCHPASSGHELNLQDPSSNTMAFFGIQWILGLYRKTVVGLWMQGQKNRTVSIIDILTKGTVDERILKVLSEKDVTQKALIDAIKKISSI